MRRSAQRFGVLLEAVMEKRTALWSPAKGSGQRLYNNNFYNVWPGGPLQIGFGSHPVRSRPAAGDSAPDGLDQVETLHATSLQ